MVYRHLYTAHRVAITARDKIVVGTITSANQAGEDGVFANSEHKTCTAPGNTFGSAGPTPLVAVTPTLNKTIDITQAAVTGATYFDVFCSTNAAPLWVGRVTEAQRAAGCSITAVGTVGAVGPGGVGKINVRLVGTGSASTAAPFALNNAFLTAGITAIDCKGHDKMYVYTDFSTATLETVPVLKIVPMFTRNEASATAYYQGHAVFDLTPAAGLPMRYMTEIDVNGTKGVIILVDTLTGATPSVNIDTELA